MSAVEANPDAQDGNEEKGIWHKRLRLRKTSFSFPSDRHAVKEESDVTAGAGTPKKLRLQAMNTFTCSQCQDGIAFRPQELITHFKIVHRGNPPVFSCNICDFSTPTFTTLKQHRIKHKNSLFTCDVCEDDVQQTLPQLIQHCQTRHSLNGQYYCTKCKLSIQNVEAFLSHSCSASVENGTKKSDLLKHMADACRQRWSRRNWWRKRPIKKDGDQMSFPKAESQWTSTLMPLTTPGLLLDPQQTLEETKQFLQRNKWAVSLKTDFNAKPQTPAGKDKLTGLMEKNNISVPADCTTKVVGFKMVDGKKHLVLKVIPSRKPDVSKDGETVIADDQFCVKRKELDAISTSGKIKKQGRCEAQQHYLSSVIEKIKSQQKDGCDNQDLSQNVSRNSPRSRKTKPKDLHSVDMHAERVKNSQDEAESEENLTTCQGDSKLYSVPSSNSGFLENHDKHDLTPDSDSHLNSSISGSPLKDLHESFCPFPGEDGELFFHTGAEESKNNTDPGDPDLPLGRSESHSAPDLLPMLEELPITTVTHLLDEVRAEQRLSSPLKDRTHSEGADERSERVDSGVFSLLHEDSSSSSSIPSSTGPIASLSRKHTGDSSSTDSQHVNKSQTHRASEDFEVHYWEPSPRNAPTTLRLIPFSSSQSVKIPQHSQPVIVLNHPDAEIPELTNIMKVVHKHKGAVTRVVLSRKTLSALSHFHGESFPNELVENCRVSRCRREWPNGTVKERFSLKLRLRRVCGRKYTVVPTVSESVVLQPNFRCWFCGRIFTNQEAWVGHGQRHLMEATRGWNQMFNRRDNPAAL